MPGYHLPYFTAAATGIYERHGISVEIVDPAPGPANARAVAYGRYDFCLTSVAHFLHARADEPELPAKFVFMVARRPHMSAFVVEGRAIESFHDLDGAAVLGEAESPFVREYLALLRHLDAEPGELIEVPYEDVFEALVQGRGDVAADFVDLRPRFDAVAAPRGERIRALPFFAAGIDIYGSGLVTSQRMIDERPADVAATVRAVHDALLATRESPATGLDALAERFDDVDRRRAVEGWTAGAALIFGEDGDLGAMDAEVWQRTLAYHAATHGTPELEPSAVFEPGFLPVRAAG